MTYLETGDILLSELTPFPGNANVGDVDKIADSITANGQYRALIVRKTDDGAHVVLAGNHTMLALASLGMESARCEIHTVDDQTATRINLIDNRAAEFSTRDEEALAELLGSLDDFSGTGYSPDDLDDLLSSVGEVPEMPVQPTGARYAEAPEEEQARRDRVEAYEPRHGGGDMTELILVMNVQDRQEASGLIAKVRERDGDLTAGQVVLYALRSHAESNPFEESSDE